MAGTHDIFLPIEDRDHKADRERDGCIDGFCPMPTPKPPAKDEPPVMAVDAPGADEVNPDHYRQGIECIDVMQSIASPEQYQGYLWLTTIKYLYRLHRKGSPELNARKAKWFLDRLCQELSE